MSFDRQRHAIEIVETYIVSSHEESPRLRSGSQTNCHLSPGANLRPSGNPYGCLCARDHLGQPNLNALCPMSSRATFVECAAHEDTRRRP